MNMLVKFNAAITAGNTLNSCSGPHVKHRALTEKDGGHLIMSNNSICAPAPLSGSSFARKASTNHTAEASQRPVFKVGVFAGIHASSHHATLLRLTHQHQSLTQDLDNIHPWTCNERRKAPEVPNFGPLPKQLFDNVHLALATGVMQSCKEDLFEMLWDEDERRHLPVSAYTQTQMDQYMKLLDGAAAEGRKAALAGTFSESSFHKGSLAAAWAEEYPTPMAARVAGPAPADEAHAAYRATAPGKAMVQEMHVDSTTGRDWINALAADPLTLRWLLRGLAGNDFADITQHPHMLEAVFCVGCLIRRKHITTEKQKCTELFLGVFKSTGPSHVISGLLDANGYMGAHSNSNTNTNENAATSQMKASNHTDNEASSNASEEPFWLLCLQAGPRAVVYATAGAACGVAAGLFGLFK